MATSGSLLRAEILCLWKQDLLYSHPIGCTVGLTCPLVCLSYVAAISGLEKIMIFN